jgi:hypothetical protein
MNLDREYFRPNRANYDFLKNHDWIVSRATELLLRGHSPRAVRDIMMLSKRDFDLVLEQAIDKACDDQERVEIDCQANQEGAEG